MFLTKKNFSRFKMVIFGVPEEPMSHSSRCLCVSIKASLYQFFTVNHSLFYAVTP